MDIFWILGPDPHNNRCGSATLLRGRVTLGSSKIRTIRVTESLESRRAGKVRVGLKQGLI